MKQDLMMARENASVHYALKPATKPEGATIRYAIEARNSTFTVSAFVSGLLAALGHSPTIALPDMEGEIFLNPEVLEQSFLRLVIQVSSMTVTDDTPAQDRPEINRRMQEEVLEVDSFPVVIYECSHESASTMGNGQYWLVLNGELMLHGVTRRQPVSAHVILNGDMLRATGDFSIRQSDYGITPVSALGGAVKLKDELKLSFSLTARKAG